VSTSVSSVVCSIGAIMNISEMYTFSFFFSRLSVMLKGIVFFNINSWKRMTRGSFLESFLGSLLAARDWCY